MNGAAPLVLIEPYAHRGGGHHQRTLAALAAARPGSLVIAPHGLFSASSDLTPARTGGARLVTSPAGPAAAVLLAAARHAAALSVAGQRLLVSRRWPRGVRRFPHQVTLVARWLTEVACLRTARRLAPNPAAVVVLSASEALHGAAALLGRQPHLRFVHEVSTTEDLPVRCLGRLARHGEPQVRALCPTTAVRDQLAAAFPRLPTSVRAFAVDDRARLDDGERDGAREAFDIPAGETAVCLVGGWWPHKDIDTIDAALRTATASLHLIVAGTPLHDAVLARWRQLPSVRLHEVPGPVPEQVLRLVYAAADAALVARRPEVGKESGLLMDAARLGVPLLVSDHDPDLTARLAGQPWTRLFPPGDPAALAKVLDQLTDEPPARPCPHAPSVLGMPTAEEQSTFLVDTYAGLTRERG